MTGRKVVANKPASGTQIIDEWGEHQMKTGDLIVYTSADPVLQIAAHEDIIPLEELYDICEKVRELTKDPKYLIGVLLRVHMLVNQETLHVHLTDMTMR